MKLRKIYESLLRTSEKSRDFNKGSFTIFQRFATLCQWTNVLPNLISVLDILMTQNICSWFVKCVLLMSELSFSCIYLFKYWPAGVISECVSWTLNQRITLRRNWFRVSEVSPITIHLFLPVKMGVKNPAIFSCTKQFVLLLDIANWCVLPYYFNILS